MEKPDGEIAPESSNLDEDQFNRKDGTAGMSGQLYEIKLLMYLLLKGIKQNNDGTVEKFQLATNVLEAEKFDDVVMKIVYKSPTGLKKLIIFLQTKHRETTKRDTFTLDKLISDSDNDFMLKKYFTSFRNIKQRFETSRKNEPIFSEDFDSCSFIIFTNAKFEFKKQDSAVEAVDIEEDNILHLNKGKQFYRIILTGPMRQVLTDYLHSSSECRAVVKELVRSMFSPKGIDVDRGVLKEFHAALARTVIEKVDKEAGKLYDGFLDAADNANKTQLQKALIQELQKRQEFADKPLEDIVSIASSTVFRVPKYFGKVKVKDQRALPEDLVNDEEISEFFDKLKIYPEQPSEEDLEFLIKKHIQDTYVLYEDSKADSCYSHFKNKVERWWIKEKYYLTEKNTFVQETVKVSTQFDVKNPVDLFTGREAELANLHERLQQPTLGNASQIVAICGLGGIGKTELSRRYIQIYRHCYDENVLWISAETEDTMNESFRKLATNKLRITTKNIDGVEKDIESIVEEVYKFFAKRKSLFVFDNIENNERNSVFLPLRCPYNHKPHIILTSRHQEWKIPRENIIPLDILDKHDAISFVQKGLNAEKRVRTQEEEIVPLLETLYYFPLAIQQAISYIKDQKITRDYNIQSYIEEYETKKELLLSSEVFKDLHNDYAKTTATTWIISIDKIKSDEAFGVVAGEIIEMIAYLSPDHIDRKMFAPLTEGNEDALRNAVRLLVKYSMIKGSKKQSVLSVHRLVQEVTRLDLKSQGREEETLKKSLRLVESNFDTSILNHSVILCDYAKQYRPLLEEFSHLPAKTVGMLETAARFEEGLQFGKKIVTSMEAILGMDHEETLRTKHNIAGMLHVLGKYLESHDVYMEVLQHRNRIHGPDHQSTLVTKRILGLLMIRVGKSADALRMLREVFENRKHDSDNPETLNIKHNMAWALKRVGQFNEALVTYKEVLEQANEMHGPDDPMTLLTKHNLAYLIRLLGDTETALTMFREVLDKRIVVFGPDHPETLRAKHNIALSLKYLGKYSEAMAIFGEVLETRYAVLGKTHPETLLTRNRMAETLHKTGKCEEALEILRDVDCIECETKIMVPIHPGTIATKELIRIVTEDMELKKRNRLHTQMSVFVLFVLSLFCYMYRLKIQDLLFFL